MASRVSPETALRRNTGTLSTTAGQLNSESSWKQEVSLRVAARRGRGGPFTEKTATSVQSRQEPISRAAQIAARVAARFAQAPSYSRIQTDVRNAVPEALPGPLEASAGASPVEFDTVEARTPNQPFTQARKPEAVPVQPIVPASLEAWESEDFRPIREPDFALRPPEPAHVRTPRPALVNRPTYAKDYEPTEPVLSTYANLIEFPRELVASRKRRPRRVEGPFAADGLERQLSIFDVDPGAYPMHPETAGVAPAWTYIEPEAQPPEELEPEEPHNLAASLPETHMAPVGLRLRAALVDFTLVAGALMGAALAAAASIGHSIPAGFAKMSAILGFLLTGLLYLTIFLVLDNATLGMMSAGLSLYTLDNEIPTRSQRCTRMGALLLSVIPMGLGAAWCLFDDDHLCWHDRLSRTYLRKG